MSAYTGQTYALTDGDLFYGTFLTEEEALFEREALASEGFETWVIVVTDPALD